MRWNTKDDPGAPPPREKDFSPFSVRAAVPPVLIKLPQLAMGVEDHDKLSEAIAVLRRLFPNCDITIEERHTRNGVPYARRTAEPVESNRDKVLTIIKDVPYTVDEIAKATGLNAKKIRGVLTAPDLKFDRTKSGSMVAYKFAGTRERKRHKSAKRTATAKSES